MARPEAPTPNSTPSEHTRTRSSPSLWLGLSLAWAFAGADVVCRLVSSGTLRGSLARGLDDPELLVHTTLRLGGLLLGALAVHHALHARAARWPWRSFAIATAALGAVLLFDVMSWHSVKVRPSLDMVLYVAENPKLLGDGPGLFANVPRAVWLACAPFVPLWLAFVVTARRRRRLAGGSGAPTTPSLRGPIAAGLAAASLVALARIDLPARADSTPAAGPAVTSTATAALASSEADWPTAREFRPVRAVPERHYRARGGVPLPRPTVVVFFVLESARAAWVDLSTSPYFSHPEHSLSVPEFFVPIPHSSNSHYSLFTGLYSARKAEERFELGDASLPADLAARGYRGVYLYGGESAFDGELKLLRMAKLENVDMPILEQRSGKRALFGWGVDDAILVDEAKKLFDTATPEAPLFLSVVYTNSHHPYPRVPGLSYDRYGDDDRGRHRTAIDRSVAQSDELVRHLEQRGVDFVAVLLSDHGESFGEHGFHIHDFSLYSMETHVPFAIYSPKLVLPSGPLPRRGTILDVWPTLADLLDWPIDAPLHGRSLFDPRYRLSLLLRGWRNADSTGLIHEDRKWIHSAPERRVRVYDLADRELADVPVTQARRFVDELTAPELLEGF